MHDLMVTLAFVSMVVVPAIIAFQNPESNDDDQSGELISE